MLTWGRTGDATTSHGELKSDPDHVRWALAATASGLYLQDYVTGEHIWSPEARRLFGVEDDFVVDSESFLNLVHPEDVASLSDDVAAAHAPDSTATEYTAKYRIRRPDGDRWIRACSQLERGRNGAVTCERGVVVDITDEVELIDRLNAVQLRDSVGRLAGGIAHDFNNLLTSILGEVDLARLHGVTPVVEESLGAVQSAAKRAAILTQQLLTFSRRQVYQPRHVDMNRLIVELQRTLTGVLGERHPLTVELHGNRVPVHVDETQFGQVLLNLVVNARDASPVDAPVIVRTREEDGDSRRAVLEVEDRGGGIPDSIRPSVFDPFFTTKDHGTGLGLATCATIVERFGGVIDLVPAEHGGTVARVDLPRVEDVTPLDAEDESGAGPHGAVHTVLVADDDPLVLSLAERGLRAFGLEPVTARSGAEALERARKLGDGIDIFVADVVMPGMSAQELCDQFREIRPTTPVLFASGYVADDSALETLLGPSVHFLVKPYTPVTLSRRVREIIDPGPG